MSQKKVNIAAGVIKMASHKMPVFEEKQGTDYVLFGKNNDYPAYLLKLYNRSAKHNAILNGKACYILGKGWEAKKAEEQSLVDEFLKHANTDESLNQISFKTILDLELFGGMAIEVVWNMLGTRAEYRHIDFSNVRSNKDNTIFYYTKKWFKKYTLDDGGESNRPNQRPDLEEDWVVYEAYNPTKRTGRQLFYFKQYRPGLDVYPLPEYLGAIPWIEIDFELANFHYHNVKNGFTATHLINFNNGIPTQEEQKKIEGGIAEKWTGTESPVKFITSYSDGKEKATEILTLTMSDIDKQFDSIGKNAQQEIFSGHNITSGMLFGIKTEGQLGGRTEIIEANELFQNTYINKKQQIVETIFNELARANGITAEIKLTHLEPIGLDWFNTNFTGILTADEKREKAGLKPIEKDTTSTATATADAIATLSPLVANKILGSMTTNEVRALAALPPIEGGDIIPSILPEAPAAFRKFTAQIDLSEFGKSKKDITILHKWNLHGIDFNEFGKYHDVTFAAAKEYFGATINATDRAILDLLIKDPLMPPKDIADVIRVPQKKVDIALSKLIKEGLIEVTTEKIKQDDFKTSKQISRTPTAEATKIVDARPPKTYNIEVLYSYEWRDGFTDADIDTSRDFCVTLLKANRLYTREEIETISGRVGRDVFIHKGGWYFDKGKDVAVPYCRHQWLQNLITTEE